MLRMHRENASDLRDVGVLVLFVGFSMVSALSWPLNVDAGWYLEAASKFLDGDHLYVDLIEVNPPLIIWLSAFPVLLSSVTGLSEHAGLVVFVLAICGVSLWTTRLVLRSDRSSDSVPRTTVFALLVATLLFLPNIHFGQREHLLMIFVLPYLLLAAVRIREGLDSSPLGRGLTVWIGIFAGLGIALKPHFMLLPAVVELWLLGRLGWRSWSRRAELWAGGTLIVAYATLVVAITPEYLSMVRLAVAHYSVLNAPTPDLLFRGEVSLVVGSGLAAWSLRSSRSMASLGELLFVAAVVLAIVAVVQQKGWRYHYYPALASGTLLVGLAIADLVARTMPKWRRAVDVTAVVSVAAFIGATVIPRFLERQEQPPQPLLRLIQEQAVANRVMVFSTHIGAAFPLVNYMGAEWTSRFPSLWLLEAFYGDSVEMGEYLLRTPGQQGETERWHFQAVVEDFVENSPDLVLVVRGVPEPGFPEGDFEYLKYYSQDERFRTAFDRYEDLGLLHPYAYNVYVKR